MLSHMGSPRGHSALGMQASLPGRLGRRAGQLGRRLRPLRSRAESGCRTAADWAGPGLASTPPPREMGGERRQALVGGRRALTLAPSAAHRGHRTMTRQDLPGRDRVYPERLQQLRARGRRISFPPPPLKRTVDEWLLPKAFLPPEPQKPALAGWTPWTSSQGTPHRPRGSGLTGPGPGACGPQQVLHNWSATQAAEQIYASIEDLAAAWHARVAMLTNVPEFRAWQRSNPTFKPQLSGSSGQRRARSSSPSCSTRRHRRDALLHLRLPGRGTWSPTL